MRLAYCTRRPLNAIGAARNRVSSTGQSNPSPMYEPVATTKSGLPSGLTSRRERAADRAFPHAAPKNHGIVSTLNHPSGELFKVPGPLSEHEAVASGAQRSHDVADNLPGASGAIDKVPVYGGDTTRCGGVSSSAILGSVPAKHSGMAASTTNTFRELGAVVEVAVLGSIINGQLTVNLVRKLTAIGIPNAYQSLVVSAVTTGTYQGEAKAATAKNHAITHIVNEVVSAAYNAFGHGHSLSLNIAGALLVPSALLSLVTIYGRRVHLERVNSAEGHPLHVSVQGQPAMSSS